MEKVTAKRGAIAKLLKDPKVRELVEDRTQAVASGAGPGDYRTDIETGPRRVRGAVIGDYDATDPGDSRRGLLRGLDAAREE